MLTSFILQKIGRYRSVLIFAIILFLSCGKAQAQGNPVKEIDSQLRAMFSPLWHPVPGPNHLFEMSCHMVDSSFFGYQNPDTLENDVWYKIYEEMRNCAYDTTAMLPVKQIFDAAMNFEPDTIPINFLAHDYLTFIDSALTTDYFFDWDSTTQEITDRGYPGEFNAYNTGKVFAVCASAYDIRFNTIHFRIDPAFMFFDDANDFAANGWTMEVDFGDGNGWQSISLNGVSFYNATYAGLGEKVMKARVLDNANTEIMSSVSVIRLKKAAYRVTPQRTYPTTIDGLNISVWGPCDPNQVPLYGKNIIYVEGLDLFEESARDRRDAGDIYQQMIQTSELADLRNFGYTFIVIDWQRSKDDIRNNAVRLADFLSDLKCRQPDEFQNDQFVIIGESMGGLVSRNAMCLMEHTPDFNPGWCRQEKMHNTRLLITVDAPHRGANIPPTYQALFRGISPIIGALGMTQQFNLGGLQGALDEPSVQQMLLYYFAPFTSVIGPHPEFVSFFHDLDSIGNYPQYAKMVALSNGSLSGRAQTRYYDGFERTPNDTLLNLATENNVWVLGIKIRLLNLNVVGQTTPNGNGPLFYGGTWRDRWRIKFRIRITHPCFLCVKIKIELKAEITGTTNALFGLAGAGMRPYDVMPGSTTNSVDDMQVGSSICRSLFGNHTPTYHGTGWSVFSRTGAGNFLGMTSSTYFLTNGMDFDFIPVFSALDYPIGTNYFMDIESVNIATKTSATPFDIISGIVESDPDYYNDRDRDPNLFRYNRNHTHIRRDVLKSWYNGHPQDDDAYWMKYPNCGAGEGNFVRFLNREIGDDSLLVENREIVWDANYDGWQYIGINQRSMHYQYPASITNWTLPGVYSKADNYTISGGVTTFLTSQDTADINYLSPPSHSLYVKDVFGWDRCCDDFSKQSNQVPKVLAPKLTEIADVNALFKLYPNPVLEDGIIAEFPSVRDANSTIQITDLYGRVITRHRFTITSGNSTFKIKVTLPETMQNGTYFMIVKNGSNQYRRAFVKSR